MKLCAHLGRGRHESPGGWMGPLREALSNPRVIEFRGLPRHLTESLHIAHIPGANPGPETHLESHVRIPGHPGLRVIAFFQVLAGKRVITQTIISASDPFSSPTPVNAAA